MIGEQGLFLLGIIPYYITLLSIFSGPKNGDKHSQVSTQWRVIEFPPTNLWYSHRPASSTTFQFSVPFSFMKLKPTPHYSCSLFLPGTLYTLLCMFPCFCLIWRGGRVENPSWKISSNPKSSGATKSKESQPFPQSRE